MQKYKFGDGGELFDGSVVICQLFRDGVADVSEDAPVLPALGSEESGIEEISLSGAAEESEPAESTELTELVEFKEAVCSAELSLTVLSFSIFTMVRPLFLTVRLIFLEAEAAVYPFGTVWVSV